MTRRTISERSASLQEGWLDELLEAPLPEEPHATCAGCAMVPPPGVRYQPGGAYFNPATKCCTYAPVLANFLVGGLLDGAESLAVGRERVRQRIAARAGVTPMGVRPTWAQVALYPANTPRFGHSLALRCPYLDDAGGCGVWRHRSGVCMTWFCKHARGAVGQRLWKALERLLIVTERALARWCVMRLDVGGDALRALFPDPDVREPVAPLTDDVACADEDHHARRWGRWAGREEAFFAEAAALVRPLAWRDIEAIGGNEVRLAATLARLAAADLAPRPLPDTLALGAMALGSGGAPEVMRVTSYSPHDPLELSREVVELLPDLVGRPLAEARALLVERRGIALDDDLVQRLVDFAVLVAA